MIELLNVAFLGNAFYQLRCELRTFLCSLVYLRRMSVVCLKISEHRCVHLCLLEGE